MLVKFQAKWYKKEIDPDFDVSLVAPAPFAAASQAASAAANAARSAAAGAASAARAAADAAASATRRTTGTGTGSATPASRAGAYGDLVLLVAHVLMLASTVVGMQPLNKFLAWQAYTLFCRTALVASGYKVFLRFGLPALRPFPAAAAPWLQQVSQSTEFFHFLLVTIMMQQRALWMGMIPVTLAAARPTLTALGARFGGHPLWARYGRTALAAVEQGEPAMKNFGANIEIALGFQAVFAALSSGMRGMMMTYVLWNSLRMRYWSPESRPYHMQAWAAMHARVQPLLRMVPSLQRFLDYPIRWFQQLGQQQHRQ